MGVLRRNGLLRREAQGPHKGGPKLREEMKRASQKGHIAPDGLSAGQSADGLVDHSLKNRGSQILTGRAVVDQGLDVGLGKHTAAGRDGVDSLIIFRVFI